MEGREEEKDWLLSEKGGQVMESGSSVWKLLEAGDDGGGQL